MKKIAISQREVPYKYGYNIDALEQSYFKYYQKFGIILIPLSNVSDNLFSNLLELNLDGIILSGGENLNPRLYRKPLLKEKAYSDNRDATEKILMDFAIDNALPVLCQCRGAQFLNVYFGGQLIQEIRNSKNELSHVGRTHKVEITEAKSISYLGKSTTIVNSYHSQGFSEKELSKKLKVFAKAPDGIIEGVYHPSFPVAGILWHPERESPEPEINEKILDAFLNRKHFWA